MSDVAEFGCVVCHLHLRGLFTPCAVHHLLTDGGRRIGHLSTIGLCPSHHNGGQNTRHAVSRHPHKREFENRYGTEEFLLDALRKLIDLKKSLTVVGYKRIEA